jgi:hypothetical protein
MFISMNAALAYSTAGSGNNQVTSALNNFLLGRERDRVVPGGDDDHGRIVRALAGGNHPGAATPCSANKSRFLAARTEFLTPHTQAYSRSSTHSARNDPS